MIYAVAKENIHYNTIQDYYTVKKALQNSNLNEVLLDRIVFSDINTDRAKEHLLGLDEDKLSLLEKLIVLPIGNTTAQKVDISKYTGRNDISLYVKQEWENYSGSVKARPAEAMVLYGILSGDIDKNTTILESSSGNTAIALAEISKKLGLKFEAAVPAHTAKEKIALLKEKTDFLYLTDSMEGSDGAYEFVKAIMRKDYNSSLDLLDISVATKEYKKIVRERFPSKNYFQPDQYNNMWNPISHYLTTGKEITDILNGREHIVFIAAPGTGGTFIGNSYRIVEDSINYGNSYGIVEMQPSEPIHGFEGIRNLETVMVPGVYKENIIPLSTNNYSRIFINTSALEELRNSFPNFGPSGLGNIAAAIEYAKTAPKNSAIVTIAPDHRSRYT